jgi:hypothetical protein
VIVQELELVKMMMMSLSLSMDVGRLFEVAEVG